MNMNTPYRVGVWDSQYTILHTQVQDIFNSVQIIVFPKWLDLRFSLLFSVFSSEASQCVREHQSKWFEIPSPHSIVHPRIANINSFFHTSTIFGKIYIF
jgi:hypothetical protein